MGAILLDNCALAVAAKMLKPEDFYVREHRLIFQSMLATAEKGQPIDPITIMDSLSSRGTWKARRGFLPVKTPGRVASDNKRSALRGNHHIPLASSPHDQLLG